MRLPKLDDDTIDVEQTKNTAWINCKTREDATAQFETSLKQTGAGIDSDKEGDRIPVTAESVTTEHL